LPRAPEVDGVLEACRELNVTLLAYSPLEQGLLTGKYRPGAAVPGPRGATSAFAPANVAAAQAVVGLLREIGQGHGQDARAGGAELAAGATGGVAPPPAARITLLRGPFR
jgi:aryl-alcohol dehydrogenase-like predicted oxidoreductase